MSKKHDITFHYTPRDITQMLLKDITFKEDDLTIEPCVGDNAFYDYIPYSKDWCEIDRGRDVFDIPDDKEFTKCVSNPPYRDNAPDGQRKNILIKMIDKYFKITKDEVWLLLNHRCFNSLTPLRLSRWRELGWSITFLRILNIKKWYGRYYWICFKQGGISIVNF